jgi:hypothetical protein
MKTRELPADFIEKCKAVTAKRPRTVIDHILAQGNNRKEFERLTTSRACTPPPPVLEFSSCCLLRAT